MNSYKKIVKRILCNQFTCKVISHVFKIKGIYIFCYHRLKADDIQDIYSGLCVHVREFENHIEFIKKNYTLITMVEAIEFIQSKSKLDKDYAVITFDDGYKDNYIYGYNLFKKHSIKPTIYLSANEVNNQEYLWFDSISYLIDKTKLKLVFIKMLNKTFKLKTEHEKKYLLSLIVGKLKELPELEKIKNIQSLSKVFDVDISKECNLMLNWDDINKLSSIGADIGGHTLNHVILSKIESNDYKKELDDSKHLIEKNINKKVDNFAYPNGKTYDYNEESKKAVSKYYKSAVTTNLGYNIPGDDLYELKRIVLGPNTSISELKFILLKAVMQK